MNDIQAVALLLRCRLPTDFHALTGNKGMIELSDRLAIDEYLAVPQDRLEDIAAFVRQFCQQGGKQRIFPVNGEGVRGLFFPVLGATWSGAFHKSHV